jgi:septal ring factor EnvC (AmiA/AmiB activator)
LKRLCCFMLLLFGLTTVLAGQSRKELENRRLKLLSEIQQTDKLLKKTAQTREQVYNRYVALQQQVVNRSALLETVQSEIDATEVQMARSESVVVSLRLDLEHMRQEYAQTMRFAFRRKMMHNPLTYLLSSANFNQMFRRWMFMRKYDAFRKRQAEAIRFTQDMLARKIKTQEQYRREKEVLLETLMGQRLTLSSEMVEKDRALFALRSDEKRLTEQLRRQQAAHDALNRAIERIISEEIGRRKPEAPRAETARPSTRAALPDNTAAAGRRPSAPAETGAVPDDNTSLGFRQRRGSMPMPVSQGVVTRPYGRQPHPVLKNIEVTNNGIDIRTREGEAVRVVHDGTVVGIQVIPGHDNTVIVQHGNYYSVYANLSSCAVQKGQQVKAGEALGAVGTNPITGEAELHFEVWNQRSRMDPAQWVR